MALRRASRTLETAVEHVVSRCCCVASEGCVDRNPSPLAGSWRSASFLRPISRQFALTLYDHKRTGFFVA